MTRSINPRRPMASGIISRRRCGSWTRARGGPISEPLLRAFPSTTRKRKRISGAWGPNRQLARVTGSMAAIPPRRRRTRRGFSNTMRAPITKRPPRRPSTLNQCWRCTRSGLCRKAILRPPCSCSKVLQPIIYKGLFISENRSSMSLHTLQAAERTARDALFCCPQ